MAINMTKEQKWLSGKYIAYKALTNMWFVGAVWLYFYRIFMTDQQVGFLDGMAFAVGLLAEVPSGALADKFGRDKIVRIGQFFAGGGLIIQALSSNFIPIFIGQAIMMIGVSLVSGADEALFFERLKFNEDSKDWRKLVTRGSQFALIATFAATILGGWLHSIEPRIPWLLNGLSFILAALIIWPIKDGRPKKTRQKFIPELKDYLTDIKTGFLEFKTPKLKVYIPIIITLQGLFYTASYGLLRIVLLDRFHFNPFWGSIAISVSSLITVALLGYMHKNADELSEKHVLTTLGIIAASGLLLSLANIGWWGYIVVLALYSGDHILQPFLSEVLNKHSPEKQRATILSVASFFRTLPYVALAPIIGYLNTSNKLEYFLIIWAILIMLSLAFYLSTKRRDTRLSLK